MGEERMRPDLSNIGKAQKILDDFDKQGLKYDGEKIRFELLAGDALRGTAKVLTFGAKKYKDRNWEKGINYSRVFGALQRHLWSWFQGDDIDEETSINHLHHASCCIMFLQAYIERSMDNFDDRPGKKETPPTVEYRE